MGTLPTLKIYTTMTLSTHSIASSTSKVNVKLAQSRLMLQVASGILGVVPLPGANSLKELLSFAEKILDLVDVRNLF